MSSCNADEWDADADETKDDVKYLSKEVVSCDANEADTPKEEVSCNVNDGEAETDEAKSDFKYLCKAEMSCDIDEWDTLKEEVSCDIDEWIPPKEEVCSADEGDIDANEAKSDVVERVIHKEEVSSNVNDGEAETDEAKSHFKYLCKEEMSCDIDEWDTLKEEVSCNIEEWIPPKEEVLCSADEGYIDAVEANSDVKYLSTEAASWNFNEGNGPKEVALCNVAGGDSGEVEEDVEYIHKNDSDEVKDGDRCFEDADVNLLAEDEYLMAQDYEGDNKPCVLEMDICSAGEMPVNIPLIVNMSSPSKKPRCARMIAYPEDSVTRSADAPTQGPSGEQSCPKSLAEELKTMRASKTKDAKNRSKLSSDQRKLLAEMKEKKQLSSFMMPDAPESKGKGKGKGSDSRVWVTCPLLQGVPTVPPPRKPQLWEVLRSHETTVAEAIPAGQSADTFVPNPVPEPIMETAVGDSDDDVIESTPPEILEPKMKRPIIFSPSTGIVQATVTPPNLVWAEIEYIGFTPKPSTSMPVTAPGLGMSATALDIEVDVEHEIPDADDSGSEVEEDNDAEVGGLRRRNVFQYPLECEDLEDDPTLAADVHRIGAEADVALRAIADNEDGDVLHFDWLGEPNNFVGVQEIFDGPSGPTFETKGLTPLEIFKKIWDDNIIDHIVVETNRYAHQLQVKYASKVNSRMSRWVDTTSEEIWRFLCIVMLQSLVVNNVEREYWYPIYDQLRIGDFQKIMPYNRFVVLKRCLHFVDNTLLTGNSSKLGKIMPIIAHLNQTFSTIYLPEQNIAIDESLLLWKGRLSFAQLIATKRARVGIKSYELCESRTGYLWRMEVYSGKGHVHAPQEAPREAIEVHEPDNEPESATSQIVYALMRPLFGKGHTLVMDNFYNAPLLSRLLKTKYRTDTMGTLRLNREFVPEALRGKKKKNMKADEVCFSTTNDLSVVVWKDKNVVAMISTFHQPEVGGKEKYGYYKYKPKVVLDYNLSMGGVDHKDQMLHAYPIERVRNMCWYKKLFRRLVNVSIHNALVIYNHDRIKKTAIGNRDFRFQLAKEIMQVYSPRALNLIKPPTPPPPTSAKLSQLHLPAKNLKRKRCKLCYAAKMDRSTVWRCGTCNVSLCIERCYTDYHLKYVCDQD